MSQKNRGKHPNDDKLFGKKWSLNFKEAVKDLSFLLTRGYGSKSATELVGNRYRLNSRQQKALTRMSAATQNLQIRKDKEQTATQLTDQTVLIDGFNLLILLESILSDAFIFKSQDGNYRDLASVHGSYRRVSQTEEAIILAGNVLKGLGVKKVIWYFDSPVSNSGRMKSMLLDLSTQHDFEWEVHLSNNPDMELVKSPHIAITSDAWILDECAQWFNFGAYLIEHHLQPKFIVAAD